MMTSEAFSQNTPEGNIMHVAGNGKSKLFITEQEGGVSPVEQEEDRFNDALKSKFGPNALDETEGKVDDILEFNQPV